MKEVQPAPTPSPPLKDSKDAATTAAAQLPKQISQRSSQATLTPASLPDGCSYGVLEGERVIWVDFPPASPDNPFYYARSRKIAIVACALMYTFWCSATATAFAVQVRDMCVDIDCTVIQSQAGIALYAWGAALMPLVMSPISEELGRRPVYLGALIVFLLFHVAQGLARNTATALVSRFMAGVAGSIGTAVVGGTMSDMFIPAHRGLPMALTGFCLYFATGIAGTLFAYVDVRLSWRWVWWIHCIGIGSIGPVVLLSMKETRAGLLLSRRAAKLNKERGLADGARYLVQAEVGRPPLSTALKLSLLRPLIFLTTEPIAMFFSLWVALAWSVMYIIIAGLPYIARNLYGMNTEQLGLLYLATCVGSCVGMVGSQIQERIYRRKVATRGVEARLYMPMVAGIILTIGCFITGFTAMVNVHWIGICFGQGVAIAGIQIIYVTAFSYVSECYGSYASSAMAGQSFLRNMVGGGLAFATTSMFEGMTPRWALVMMGAVAAVLALVPFIAFRFGPQLRARSKYSRHLMEQETEALETEMIQRQARGLDMTGVEINDLDGDPIEKPDVGASIR